VTVARGGREAGVLRVIVLADDLIWATRLIGQLRTLGVDPVRVGSADALTTALAPRRLPGRRACGQRMPSWT